MLGVACLWVLPMLNPGQTLLFDPSTFPHKAQAATLHPSEWLHQLTPVCCPWRFQESVIPFGFSSSVSFPHLIIRSLSLSRMEGSGQP